MILDIFSYLHIIRTPRLLETSEYVALILFLFAISGSDHRPDSRFTLIDANGVLFQQSSWSFLQPLQFIYRYGIFSMLKLNYFIQGMLNDFSNIYAFLDEGLELDTTRVGSLLPFLCIDFPGTSMHPMFPIRKVVIFFGAVIF